MAQQTVGFHDAGLVPVVGTGLADIGNGFIYGFASVEGFNQILGVIAVEVPIVSVCRGQSRSVVRCYGVVFVNNAFSWATTGMTGRTGCSEISIADVKEIGFIIRSKWVVNAASYTFCRQLAVRGRSPGTVFARTE